MHPPKFLPPPHVTSPSAIIYPRTNCTLDSPAWGLANSELIPGALANSILTARLLHCRLAL